MIKGEHFSEGTCGPKRLLDIEFSVDTAASEVSNPRAERSGFLKTIFCFVFISIYWFILCALIVPVVFSVKRHDLLEVDTSIHMLLEF